MKENKSAPRYTLILINGEVLIDGTGLRFLTSERRVSSDRFTRLQRGKEEQEVNESLVEELKNFFKTPLSTFFYYEKMWGAPKTLMP